MAEFITMSDDEWMDKYRPIQNPLEEDAPFDGCLLETYGADLFFIEGAVAKGQPVWTLLDVGGDQFIVPGKHYVNRMGFFITAVAPEHDDIEVVVEDLTEP